MQTNNKNQYNNNTFNLRDIQTPAVGKRNKKGLGQNREYDGFSDQENSTFDSFDEKRLKESDFDEIHTSKKENECFNIGTFVSNKNINRGY